MTGYLIEVMAKLLEMPYTDYKAFLLIGLDHPKHKNWFSAKLAGHLLINLSLPTVFAYPVLSEF